MTKFFRRYGQNTLMYVMAALLVIWLLEGVMMRGGGRGGGPAMSDEVIGTAFGEPVRQGTLRRAKADLEIAYTLASSFDPSTGRRIPPVAEARGSDAQKNEIATALMLTEAERMGFKSSHETIRKQLAAIPEIGGVINTLMARHQTTEDAIIDAVARVLALQKLENLFGGVESLPRLEKVYVDHNERMDGRVSAIDVEPFIAQVPAPTDADLESLFNEGKDRVDSPTEDTLNFGYQVPDKVVVQYVTVDPTPLIENIRVSEKEARPYYEANLKRFTKRSDGPQLDPTRPAMVQMTFEEAESRVKDEVRQMKASDEAASAINGIIEELKAAWDAVPPDANGKRAAPSPEKIVSLQELAQKFSRGGVTVVYHETPPVDLSALRIEPGLGRAMFMTPQNQTVYAAELAFGVEGLPESPRLTSLGLAPLRINEPSPLAMSQVFGTQARQPFVFRVVKVQPKAPPASWTEVREKLESDYKLKHAFDLAGEAARKFADTARTEGLDVAFASSELRTFIESVDKAASTQPVDPATTPKTYLKDFEPVDAANFTRQGVQASNIGYSKKLAEAAFAATSQPASQPASQGARRVVVQPLAKAKKWAVLEFQSPKPLYQDDFAKAIPSLHRYLNTPGAMGGTTEAILRVQDWCNTENVFKRTGYTPVK